MMKTCKEISKLASRAHDESIVFSDKLNLFYHLSICKNCRSFYNNNKKLSLMLKDYQDFYKPNK